MLTRPAPLFSHAATLFSAPRIVFFHRTPHRFPRGPHFAIADLANVDPMYQCAPRGSAWSGGSPGLAISGVTMDDLLQLGGSVYVSDSTINGGWSVDASASLLRTLPSAESVQT